MSTERQAREGNSLGTDEEAGFQEEACRQLCEERSWEVCGAFRDAASGRSLKKRPGLQAAVAAACDAKGVLVLFSVSRLARRLRLLYEIFGVLQDAGAQLASVSERMVDTTQPFGEVLFAVFGLVAQIESDMKGQFVKASNGHIVERNRCEAWPDGFRSAGNQLYGWKYSLDKKTLIHVASEQRAIRRIMQFRTLEPGAVASIATIARLMNKTTMRPRKAATWSEEMVRRIVLRAETPEL